MSQQPQQQQQQSFSDDLNNNNGTALSSPSSFQFDPVLPTEGTTPATSSDPTDLFKRRLSEVAWSHSMEVSEEKRYKMTNKRR